MSLRIIFLFVIAGTAGFGVFGLANTLTTSGHNEIQTIQIVDAHAQSIRSIDLGTSSTISSVPLIFQGNNNFWNGRICITDKT